jgi:hypothetical protein
VCLGALRQASQCGVSKTFEPARDQRCGPAMTRGAGRGSRRRTGRKPGSKGGGLCRAFFASSGSNCLGEFRTRRWRQFDGGIVGQIVVMRLFRDFGFLTEICANNFMVLKAAPPLVASDEHIDRFVAAVHDVVKQAHSPGAFRAEALGLARGAPLGHEETPIRLQFLTRGGQSL